jgi:hypothetical protein
MFGWTKRRMGYGRKCLGTTLAALGTALVLLVVCLVPQAPAHAANPPKKEAHVNNEAKANGTSASPIPVRLNDRITYDITVGKDLPPGGKYDVLFALSWGGNLYLGKMDDGTGNIVSGAQYAKYLILEMSQYIFANYPGSRVAVMGLGADGPGNTNNYQKVFIPYDTPFVDAAGYASVLAPTFSARPGYSAYDDAQFLRAAVEKMNGDNSTHYGTALRVGYDRHVVPRDELNAGRIPVIVYVSDFQAQESPASAGSLIGANNSGAPYWSDCLHVQSDRFAREQPDGILLTVRIDHSRNFGYSYMESFSTPVYDNLMTTYLCPAGHANWQFTRIDNNMSTTTGLNMVKNVFSAAAPPPVAMSLKDTIPDGLVIVGTSPTAVVNGQTVTWDLATAPVGDVYRTVVTEVVAPPQGGGNDYANTATLSVDGVPDVKTNTTYHRLGATAANDLILHIRQVIVSPATGTPWPLAGYFRLGNGGNGMPVTGESGVHGFGLTDYSTYKLMLSGSDEIVRVHCFVPQHYEYAGYFQNSGGAAAGGHDSLVGMVPPASTPNGLIILDYGALQSGSQDEQWLTVYIRPAGAPGDFEWSYASNDFGTVA